eukprot:6213614-Pleurochrysis_carterae.AAC.3
MRNGAAVVHCGAQGENRTPKCPSAVNRNRCAITCAAVRYTRYKITIFETSKTCLRSSEYALRVVFSNTALPSSRVPCTWPVREAGCVAFGWTVGCSIHRGAPAANAASS